MTKPIREQIEYLERHGFKVDVRRRCGTQHVQLRVRHGKRSGLVTVSLSPSDHRTLKNNLSCARRACGVA